MSNVQFKELVAAHKEHTTTLRRFPDSGHMPELVESSPIQARSAVLKDVYLRGKRHRQ